MDFLKTGLNRYASSRMFVQLPVMTAELELLVNVDLLISENYLVKAMSFRIRNKKLSYSQTAPLSATKSALNKIKSGT